MHKHSNYLSVCLVVFLVAHVPETKAEFYIGAAVLYSDSELDSRFRESINDNPYGYKLDTGYNFNRFLAVQFSYQDFGLLDSGWRIIEGGIEGAIGQKLRVESKSFSASAVAKWPISERFNLIGEVGIEKWEVDYDGELDDPFGPPGYTFSSDDDGTFWGVGASYDITENWGASLKYYYRKWDTQFNKDKLEHQSLAAGVYYRF